MLLIIEIMIQAIVMITVLTITVTAAISLVLYHYYLQYCHVFKIVNMIIIITVIMF